MRRKPIFCLCLLLASHAWPGRAQETTTPEPKTAPAAQTQPAPVQPVQQQTTPAGTSTAETYQTSDGATSLELFYWLNPAEAGIRTGKLATATNPSVFDFSKNTKGSPGAILSFPVGRYHALRFAYFRTQAHGNRIVGSDINLYGVDYLKGQLVSNNYTIQNAKVSLDFTSWPFPVNNSRFRVKTFWEVQYLNMRTGTDAPLEPTIDADGNFVNHAGGKTHWFIYPSFGMGIEYFLSKHFRFESKGSGFALPGRSNVWDADATFAYRQNQWEINFGGKAFHFRTSPKREEYYKGTFPGVFVGMRWYP